MSGSLVRRIIISGLIWLLLGLGIGGFVIMKVFEGSMIRQFDSRLEAHLNLLTVGVAQTAADPGSLMTDPDFQRAYSGSYWQAIKENGDRFSSRSLWDFKLPNL